MIDALGKALAALVALYFIMDIFVWGGGFVSNPVIPQIAETLYG